MCCNSYVTEDGVGVPDNINGEQRNLMVYSNPFTDETSLSFYMETPGKVRIDIISVNGEMINTLTDTYLNVGYHEYIRNGRNVAGKKVPAGIYLFKRETPQKIYYRKIIYSD